jgi:glycolate oxidase FAD binding subunit
MDRLLQRLESIVTAPHVLTGGATSAYAVDGVAPRAVVFPAGPEEVAAILAVCHEVRAALTPWGGGTAMGLGSPPGRLDVVLGLRRLNQVLDHEPADMTSTAQAGVTLLEYQAALGKNGQFLALDAPHAGRATLGGILAANTSGPRRFRYGTMRDLVIGLRVVQADGTPTRAGAKVVKNVTGYDMNKLYVGSLGTLGVIVEASFRLYPLPAAERTWLGAFPAVRAACQAAVHVIDSAATPASVVVLNAPAAVQVAGLVTPGIAAGPWLAVSLASIPRAVEAQLDVVRRVAAEAGRTAEALIQDEMHERFRQAVCDLAPDPGGMALKAGMLPGAVAPACEHAETLATQAGLPLRVAADVGTGVVRYYTGSTSEGPAGPQALASLVAPLRARAAEGRGWLVVTEAPPETKAHVDVWGDAGDAFPLMRDLKRSFDPEGILSPGRFVGRL